MTIDIKELIEKTKEDYNKVLSFYEKDIAGIRTGRASAGLVENVIIDSYGSNLPLKQVASINITGPRQLTILPWDKSLMSVIEKAILSSGLGLNPSNDGNLINIFLPPLSEEFRKNLTKILNEKSEDARISLRKIREEAWKKIQDGAREGNLREDDKFKGKEELQRTIDEYNKKIEIISERKNKEIMEN